MFTLSLDYASGILISFVISWNLLLYLLYHLGFVQDKIQNRETMEFQQYDKDILLLRLLYIIFVAIVLIPLFLKNKLHSLQKTIEYFSVYTFLLYLFILVLVMIEKPSLEKLYPITINWIQTEDFSMNDISLFYAVFSAFYIQPYLLTYKRNLISNVIINRAHSEEIE